MSTPAPTVSSIVDFEKTNKVIEEMADENEKNFKYDPEKFTNKEILAHNRKNALLKK